MPNPLNSDGVRLQIHVVPGQRPEKLLSSLVRLAQMMTDGELPAAALDPDAATQAHMTRELCTALIAKLALDHDLDHEEAWALAGLQLQDRRRGAATGRALEPLGPLGHEADWTAAVARAALWVLRASDVDPALPMRRTHATLVRLWLLACREAGCRFVIPREVALKEQYFLPACAGGWMQRASWLGPRGSVNKVFDALADQHPDLVVRRVQRSALLGVDVAAYGLTRAGCEAFWDDIQNAGLDSSALSSMGDALRLAMDGGLGGPGEHLNDPDNMLGEE